MRENEKMFDSLNKKCANCESAHETTDGGFGCQCLCHATPKNSEREIEFAQPGPKNSEWEESWMTEEVEALWQTDVFREVMLNATPLEQTWMKSAIAYIAHNFADKKCQERSKDTVGEFLRKLPEEKIIHSYMSKQGEHSTEYCEGWNDYRLVAIQKLSEQLNQK